MKDDNIRISAGEHKGKFLTGIKMVQPGLRAPKKYYVSYGNLNKQDLIHELPIDEVSLRLLFVEWNLPYFLNSLVSGKFTRLPRGAPASAPEPVRETGKSSGGVARSGPPERRHPGCDPTYVQGSTERHCAKFAMAKCIQHFGLVDKKLRCFHSRIAGLEDSLKPHRQLSSVFNGPLVPGWQGLLKPYKGLTAIPDEKQEWPLLVGIGETNGRDDHSVVIMHNLIFDANFDKPLTRSAANLDKVCISGRFKRAAEMVLMQPASPKLRCINCERIVESGLWGRRRPIRVTFATASIMHQLFEDASCSWCQLKSVPCNHLELLKVRKHIHLD